MAKASKKSADEASNLFHNIIAASVKGNPKPDKKPIKSKTDKKNIYQMYVENGCKLGFYVTRDTWSDDKYAQVVGIDGVKDGEMIEGEPPYFNRVYPESHPKAGKIWQRGITLKAAWFDGGIHEGSTGGVYSFTRVYPNL